MPPKQDVVARAEGDGDGGVDRQGSAVAAVEGGVEDGIEAGALTDLVHRSGGGVRSHPRGVTDGLGEDESAAGAGADEAGEWPPAVVSKPACGAQAGAAVERGLVTPEPGWREQG